MSSVTRMTGSNTACSSQMIPIMKNVHKLLLGQIIAVLLVYSNFIDTASIIVSSLHIPSMTKYSVARSKSAHITIARGSNYRYPSPLLASSGIETTTSVSSLPTLSSDTTWMIRLTLRNIKTQQGRTITNQMYVINGKFIPEENYEPPQGSFVQQPTSTTTTPTEATTTTVAVPSSSASASSDSTMQITSSRWILSEDPNDRKDGLWIWGLFQQPLYPYLLLSLETKPIEIRNSGDTLDYIPALQLYVQLDHNCNRDTGSVSLLKKRTSSDSTTTSSGSNYELMIRQKEIIAADPLSLSKVEIYEEVSIGTISIQPK